MSDSKHPPAALTALALLAMTCALGASNARAQATAPLTADELRSCIAQQDTLEQRTAGLMRAAKEVESAKTALALEAGKIAEAQKDVNPKDKKAIAAYNARAVDYNRSSQEFNAQALALNALGRIIQGEREAFTAACVNRNFRAVDREAILKQQAKP